jgi:hypothetical protein
MLVVVFLPPTPAGTPRRADRMRVVKTHQPIPVRPVQGQGIVEAVWLLVRRRYTLNHETHPVLAIGIEHQDLPIQFEEGIKRWISFHNISLSDTDKKAREFVWRGLLDRTLGAAAPLFGTSRSLTSRPLPHPYRERCPTMP